MVPVSVIPTLPAHGETTWEPNFVPNCKLGTFCSGYFFIRCGACGGGSVLFLFIPSQMGWNVQLRAMGRGSRECRIIHKDKTATLGVAQGHPRVFSGRRRCRSSYSKQTRIDRPTDLGERAALIYLCSVLLLLDEKRGIKQQKVIAIIIPHDDAAVARSCGDDAFRRAYDPLGRSLFFSSNHKV